MLLEIMLVEEMQIDKCNVGSWISSFFKQQQQQPNTFSGVPH